jgi:hypothetical protein
MTSTSRPRVSTIRFVRTESCLLKLRFVPMARHRGGRAFTVHSVPDLLTLAVRLLVTVAKLLSPGGVRAVAAESLLLKHRLLSVIDPGGAMNSPPTAFRQQDVRISPLTQERIVLFFPIIAHI